FFQFSQKFRCYIQPVHVIGGILFFVVGVLLLTETMTLVNGYALRFSPDWLLKRLLTATLIPTSQLKLRPTLRKARAWRCEGMGVQNSRRALRRPELRRIFGPGSEILRFVQDKL